MRVDAFDEDVEAEPKTALKVLIFWSPCLEGTTALPAALTFESKPALSSPRATKLLLVAAELSTIFYRGGTG